MRIRIGSVYAGMDSKKGAFDVIGQLAALRRYARSLARNSPDAEDLVHDALVRAYERRSTFRSGANLRNWLFAIVRNAHIDRVRSAMSRGQRDGQTAQEAALSYPAHQEHSVRLAQVREAFMLLPEEQREALHLVAVEDQMEIGHPVQVRGDRDARVINQLMRSHQHLVRVEHPPRDARTHQHPMLR